MLALLLAAGSGRRLGCPKALVELEGRTALEWCLSALREGGVDELRVVLGRHEEEIRARVDLRGVEVVVNPRPERGQTSSLQLGLAAGTGSGDGFLLHTVDHPLVESASVAALLAAWRTRERGTKVLVPSALGRRGHPVLFAATLADEFGALGEDEPAHYVLRCDPERVQHVVLHDLWLVRDIDTPEDLEAARAALRRDER